MQVMQLIFMISKNTWQTRPTLRKIWSDFIIRTGKICSTWSPIPRWPDPEYAQKLCRRQCIFQSAEPLPRKFKFKNAEAHNLRLAFEQVTGEDLNWYWNQWYFGSGHPVFDISYAYDDSKKMAKVVINQVQNTGKIFRIPWPLMCMKAVRKHGIKSGSKMKAIVFISATIKDPTLSMWMEIKLFYARRKIINAGQFYLSV